MGWGGWGASLFSRHLKAEAKGICIRGFSFPSHPIWGGKDMLPFFNPTSPDIHLQILQTYLYTFPYWISGENLKNYQHFCFGDHFINSHNLFSWTCSDIVRRKLMFIFWVNSPFLELVYMKPALVGLTACLYNLLYGHLTYHVNAIKLK